MSYLDTFRQEYPAYANVSDGKLAYGIWNKYYRDRVGMGEVADKLDLSKEAFNEMLSFAEASGTKPTGSTFAEGYVPEGSRARALLSGQTFQGSDEIVGTLTAGAQKIMGDKRSFSDLQQAAIDREKALLEQYHKADPMEAAGMEIAGSFMNPAMWLKTPALVAKLGPKSQAVVKGVTGLVTNRGPVKQAAIKGAAGGGLYGYGSGTDEQSRQDKALEGAAFGALFGAGAQKASNWATSAVQKVADKTDFALLASIRNPTIESLKSAKNAAYAEVDKIGKLFGVDDMDAIYQAASASPRLKAYLPSAHPKVASAQRYLETELGNAHSLSQMDSIRKNLWRVWRSADEEQQWMIRDIIRVFDDVVDSKLGSGGSTVYRSAQLANARYRKAELLDKAFEMANLETSATGSGGNLFNKYRQAVVRILKDKKNLNYFTDEEIASMQAFVKGEFGEGALRTISKLSPSGNGLMAALNIGAAAVDPTFLAAGAAGMAAKGKLDRQINRQAQSLINEMGQGGVPFSSPSPLQGLTAPTGAFIGNRPQDERERR